MIHTKPQRVMAMVLAIGAGALAFDRLVLGTGATQPKAASADTGAEGLVPQTQAREPAVRLRTVASQLGAVPVAGEVQDAFFDRLQPVVPEIIEVPGAGAEVAGAETPSQTRQSSEAARSLVLTAILSTPAGPIAVVNGRALQADRPSGGMTLRSVEGGAIAVVEIAGETKRLEIVRDSSEPRRK